ncbi:MAG: hypothetical protein ACYDH5_10650 [Acidimicrobiales bacterium]
MALLAGCSSGQEWHPIYFSGFGVRHKPAPILKGAYGVLRVVLTTAVELGAIRVNPCAGVRVPKGSKGEMHFLIPEQVAALAEAMEHPNLKPAGDGALSVRADHCPEYALLVRFAAYTGMRAGEIDALRAGRVDLVGRAGHRQSRC